VDRNDRNILILGILILIVLAIAYFFLLLSPLRAEYLAAYDERTQKEARKSQLDQTVAQLENVRRNASDVERQILELSKRIPEQDEIPTLIVQIEEVARAAQVTQFSIEPGSPEAPPGGGDFSRIPITMTFQGRYEQMQDFLLRLRNLARLVTVNEVTYCRFPKPITDASCPVHIEEGETTTRETTTGESTARETTTGETTRGETTTRESTTTTRESTDMNSEVESLLQIQVEAEVYVQPAAGGRTTPAGGAATTPSGGEATAPASGGAPKGAGAAK
jgi:type IV pilus assembly protein PilO